MSDPATGVKQGARVAVIDGQKTEEGPAGARSASGGPAERSPEDERARRFLDLWERNLSFLALNGPAPGGPPPGR